MFIAFSGSDGVGKSSLIKAVEKTLSNKGYLVKAFKPITSESDFSRKLAKVKAGYEGSEHDLNTEIRSLIAFETYKVSEEISKEIDKYDYIIVDRWTACQKIYASVWKNEHTFADHILDCCLKPDIIFVINSDLEEVSRRLSLRESLDPTESIYALKRVLRKYKKYTENESSAVLIDNHDGKFENALNKIIKIIGV